MPIRLSRGCGPSSQRVKGQKLFMQADQDVGVGGRASPPSSIHPAGLDIEQLNEWAPKMPPSSSDCRSMRDVAPISRVRTT